MERNDGQRRRDGKDGYAPFEVRPALRRDPEPAYPWRVVVAFCLLVLAGCVLGICVAVSQP